MATGKGNLGKNLALLVLGAGWLATWGAAACDSGDGSQDVQVGAAPRMDHRPVLEEVDQIPEGYVATPNGVLMHGDCLHQIPDGAVVHADWSVTLNGAKIAQYGTCTHKKYRYRHKSSTLSLPGPDSTGYVFFPFEESFETMFTHMNTGSWIVPPNPVGNHGQVLYFFPSLESDTAILQPVLQWGQICWAGGRCAGTPTGWTYANWWVTSSDPQEGPPAFVSISKPASAGDNFYATFDLGPVFWYIQVNDTDKGTSTLSSIETDSNPFHIASGGALEAYGVTTCSDFPSGSSGWTYFSRPVLYQGPNYWTRDIVLNNWSSINWTTSGYLDLGEPVCNFAGSNVDAVGNTTIDY